LEAAVCHALLPDCRTTIGPHYHDDENKEEEMARIVAEERQKGIAVNGAHLQQQQQASRQMQMNRMTLSSMDT
jgi:ABC-type uncharacterized transport system substrate-binding protein